MICNTSPSLPPLSPIATRQGALSRPRKDGSTLPPPPPNRTQRGYAARAAPTQKNPIKPINLLFPHAKSVEPLPPTATPGAKAGRTHNCAHNALPVTPPPRAAHHMHTYSYPHPSRESILEQKYVETATLPPEQFHPNSSNTASAPHALINSRMQTKPSRLDLLTYYSTLPTLR